MTIQNDKSTVLEWSECDEDWSRWCYSSRMNLRPHLSCHWRIVVFLFRRVTCHRLSNACLFLPALRPWDDDVDMTSRRTC